MYTLRYDTIRYDRRV